MSTVGQPIECRAAICWGPKKSLTVEKIKVDPPKAGEVRIKILANSICGTDVHCYKDDLSDDFAAKYPCILGHEAAGIVESIGEGVTSVEEGDHVIPMFVAQCKNCEFCKNPKTNMCLSRGLDETAMKDGSSRFSLNGQTIHHFMGCSTLSQYTVCNEEHIAKVDKEAAFDKICILGCGFPTGFGATTKRVVVNKGDTVGVWGLGSIGLAAVYGAYKNGASKIIGFDINEEKIELAKKMGCTHFVNPKSVSNIAEKVKEMTNGVGLDYGIECIGNVHVIEDAFNCVRNGWGTVVVVGVAPSIKKLELNPFHFLAGRSIVGEVYGHFNSRDDIPVLVDRFVKGDLDLGMFFTDSVPLDQVNKPFEELAAGKTVLRTCVKLWE